jgi:hypothetical protein
MSRANGSIGRSRAMTFDDPLGLFEGLNERHWLEKALGIRGNSFERSVARRGRRAVYVAVLFALIAGGGVYLLDHSFLRAFVAAGCVCLVYWRAWVNGRTFLDRVRKSS